MSLSSSITSQTFTDLFWSRLIVSSKVFQVVFVHLVSNSALFLASCCFSLLLHVAANLICNFLVSRQPVLFSTLPKYLLSFCGQKGVPGCLLKNFIPTDVNRFLSFSLGVKISLPYKRMGTVSALYTFICENFWMKVV